jgi:hypothetical protein
LNALWIPIFSMRSYETGKYAILKDGNFQLTMARVLASDFDEVFVTVPEDSSDMDDLLARFKDHSNIHFTKVKYGANAVETRERFWGLNEQLMSDIEADGSVDVLVTDITGYSGNLPVIYNFNITKLPELDRPYIDKFFEQDLKSIEQSLFTTVLNPRQRDYILEVRPDLLNKVIVNTKCAHEDLLPQVAGYGHPSDPMMIFWPFRISDKAYQWKQFCEMFEREQLFYKGWWVLITDPNDTATDLPEFVQKTKLTKDEYYEILSEGPIVVMLDDIDTVLHPGTIEFFHYGSPVIAFEADLIDNPNAIKSLDELPQALDRIRFDSFDEARWRTHRFVYSSHEIDQYYNQVFVNVRKA